MKKLLPAGIIIALLGAGVYALINFGSTETYTSPEPEPVVEEEPAPVDNVSEAQKQLDEAKRLLAEEESKLLAEIKEREDRLEEIREVRLSFSQAPTPAQ